MRTAYFPFLKDLSGDGSFFVPKTQECARFRHIRKRGE